MGAFFRREFRKPSVEDRFGGADELHDGDIAGTEISVSIASKTVGIFIEMSKADQKRCSVP
ncbi:hypothetical protein ACFSUK_04515 [Sphingobium scionense]